MAFPFISSPPGAALEGNFTSWSLKWNVSDPSLNSSMDIYIDEDANVLRNQTANRRVDVYDLDDGTLLRTDTNREGFPNEKKLASILNRYQLSLDFLSDNLVYVYKGAALQQTINVNTVEAGSSVLGGRLLGVSPTGKFLGIAVFRPSAPRDRMTVWEGT